MNAVVSVLRLPLSALVLAGKLDLRSGSEPITDEAEAKRVILERLSPTLQRMARFGLLLADL